MTARARSRAELLLELADDELILGWRNSEWTGIAPFPRGGRRLLLDRAERDRARSGAVRAGGTGPRHGPDSLAFDRRLEEYRCAPLVELRRLEWARTIARHWLYETADAIRLDALKASDDPEVAGLAAKMDREEVYHRMHADMWLERLLASDEGRERLEDGVLELWPYALGVLDDELRPRFAAAARERLPFELPDDSRFLARGTRRSSKSCWTR